MVGGEAELVKISHYTYCNNPTCFWKVFTEQLLTTSAGNLFQSSIICWLINYNLNLLVQNGWPKHRKSDRKSPQKHCKSAEVHLNNVARDRKSA